MSVEIDPSAIIAAKVRHGKATGRYAQACGGKNGVSDPGVVRIYGELVTARIAREIVTNFAKHPHLTVPQRRELIELLLPSDSAEVVQLLDELRDHAVAAELAYGT